MDDRPAIDLSPEHRRVVVEILSRHLPAGTVWAFGSRVRGPAKRYSDLDLAVIARTPVSPRTLAALEEAFSQSDLPWRVDVIDWATSGEGFRRVVERDMAPLF